MLQLVSHFTGGGGGGAEYIKAGRRLRQVTLSPYHHVTTQPCRQHGGLFRRRIGR
jgi:hypothetical protein